MKIILFYKYLLNKSEKIKILYIGLLMLINTLLELLSVGLIMPVMSVLMKEETDFLPNNIYEIIKNFEYLDLVKLSLFLIITIYFIKNLFIIFYNYTQGIFIRDLQTRVASDLFKRYIFKNYSFFLQKKTGFILRNLDTSRLASYCLLSYMTVALEILITLFFLIYIFYLEFVIASIISTIFIVFGYTLYLLTQKNLYQWGEDRQNYDAKVNQQIIQSFSLIKNIKIFGKEKKMLNFFENLLFNFQNLDFKIGIVQQLPRALVELLGVFSIAILILILSVNGKTSGEIIALMAVFVAIAIRLMPSSTRIIAASQRIRTFVPAINLMREEFFTDEKEDINNDEKKIEPIKFNNLNLINVNFSYNLNEKPILSDINFEVTKGEIIGIIGESGSGKSTLVNLISGLLKPTTGKVNINGENLENLKKNWTSVLGYVSQQTTLFNDTISNNISFFEDDTENTKINETLKKVNLLSFIKSLPDQENTIVGENAASLSGGQTQRIGIARALFNNPEFLIFDESTNSLDLLNEKEIMKFIYSLKGIKTILIISHDIKVLENCDKIFEIKDKKITQRK